MEGTIGEIKLFAANWAPRGWLFCDGQTLQINQYMALYSLLGTKYGGDGRMTFSLPKIAPLLGADTATPYDDLKYIICIEGLYPNRP